jgi:hypothetical protein
VYCNLTNLNFSSVFNNFGGFFNASNFPNVEAFAVLKADGSIVAWGQSGTKKKFLLFAHLTWGAFSASFLFWGHPPQLIASARFMII